MKELIIIGAGGMGRSIYDMAKESVGYKEVFVIKGFIDDNISALDTFPNYPPVLGSIAEYIPQKDDAFVSSIGGKARKKCMQTIIDRGGSFMQLIHNTARIGTNVSLGEGNFVGAYSVIGADAVVGSYNMIQSYCVLGHDMVMGDWNRIDTHVVCVGGVKIEDEVDIHTSAVINHKVVIESNSVVGACSFVVKRVKKGTSVFGVPATRF